MNKVFKTIWNTVRQCFVVASELTGCRQSCGAARERLSGKSKSESEFFRPRAIAVAVASAFLALGAAGNASATVTLTSGCTSAGGTMVNGVCQFVGKTLGNNGLNDTWTLSSGSALIQDEIYYVAKGAGASGTIKNTGSGTLTISGGTGSYDYGIRYFGDGDYNNYANVTLTNSGSGKFIIPESRRQ